MERGWLSMQERFSSCDGDGHRKWVAFPGMCLLRAFRLLVWTYSGVMRLQYHPKLHHSSTLDNTDFVNLQFSELFPVHRFIQSIESGKVASLEPKDVIELLKTYKHIPRPRPKSSTGVTYATLKPSIEIEVKVLLTSGSSTGNQSRKDCLQDIRRKFCVRVLLSKLGFVILPLTQCVSRMPLLMLNWTLESRTAYRCF